MKDLTNKRMMKVNFTKCSATIVSKRKQNTLKIKVPQLLKTIGWRRTVKKIHAKKIDQDPT